MNPRELAACAEAAMMTAKAQGKNRIVLYDERGATERPGEPPRERDVRSVAHMKMLQSLSGKLNRLNDVREIGNEIASELRSLIALQEDARYVLFPVEIRFDPAERGTGRAVLRVAILDARMSRITWMGDVLGDPASTFSPALAASVAGHLADLVAAAP
jgi:hypothetical protein